MLNKALTCDKLLLIRFAKRRSTGGVLQHHLSCWTTLIQQRFQSIHPKSHLSFISVIILPFPIRSQHIFVKNGPSVSSLVLSMLVHGRIV
jgi:hypothetical protein